MTPIYSPTHRDVDLALESLEIEDERQKEALRRYYARERSVHISYWQACKFFAKCLLALGVVVLLLWLWPIGERKMWLRKAFQLRMACQAQQHQLGELRMNLATNIMECSHCGETFDMNELVHPALRVPRQVA